MYIKNGVSLSKLQACMIPAFIVCNDFCEKLKIPFVVTSGNDGVHEANSFHYVGLAVDLRTNQMTADQQQLCVTYLRERLDYCYDIILEIDHIHVEYQEHK